MDAFTEPRDIDELDGSAVDRITASVYGKKFVTAKVLEEMMNSPLMEDLSIKDVKAVADKVAEAALAETLRLVYRCRNVSSELVEFQRVRVGDGTEWIKIAPQ